MENNYEIIFKNLEDIETLTPKEFKNLDSLDILTLKDLLYYFPRV